MSSTGARSREASSDDGGGDAGVDDVAPRGPFDEVGLEHAPTTTLNTQTALRAARIYSFRAFQICSAGQWRAQSSGTKSSYVVVALSVGRSSMRSSTTKPW
jgi:hypothetical protein